MSQELLKRLDELAAYLGTTAERLVAALTKLAFSQGIADLLVAAILLLLVVALPRLVVRWTSGSEWHDSQGRWGEARVAVMVLTCAATALTFVFALVNLHSGIRHVLAPEGSAIKDILNLLN
jgi:Ca2+/Na+ antiporter